MPSCGNSILSLPTFGILLTDLPHTGIFNCYSPHPGFSRLESSWTTHLENLTMHSMIRNITQSLWYLFCRFPANNILERNGECTM